MPGEYVYDEEKTRAYRTRELKKLDEEYKKTIEDYNDSANSLEKYKSEISSLSEMYKNSYTKLEEVGLIGEEKINGSEKLLSSSKSINELMVSIEGLINQINNLKNTAKLDYERNKMAINNHREYKWVVKEETNNV